MIHRIDSQLAKLKSKQSKKDKTEEPQEEDAPEEKDDQETSETTKGDIDTSKITGTDGYGYEESPI